MKKSRGGRGPDTSDVGLPPGQNVLQGVGGASQHSQGLAARLECRSAQLVGRRAGTSAGRAGLSLFYLTRSGPSPSKLTGALAKDMTILRKPGAWPSMLDAVAQAFRRDAPRRCGRP